MSWAQVGSDQYDTWDGSTFVTSASTSYTVTAGTDLVVFSALGFAQSAGQAPTISVSGLGATWTTVLSYTNTSTQGSIFTIVGTNPTAGAGTLSITFSVASAWSSDTCDFSGGTTTVDVSTTGTSSNAPSVTTTVVGDLVLATRVSATNASQIAGDTGWTNFAAVPTASGASALGAAFQVQSAAGATSLTTTNGNAGDQWGVVALKAAVTVSGSPVSMLAPAFNPTLGRGWGPKFRPVVSYQTASATDSTVTGAVAALAIAAPAGLVSVDITGATAALTLAAPAGSVSTAIAGSPTGFTLTAPVGSVSTTLPGATAALTLTAPAGTTSATINGAVATFALAALAGVVATTLPGATAQLTLAAPAGSVSTGLPGATAALTLNAAAGSVGITILGATSQLTLTAPASTVSVTLPGATAALTFAAPAGSVNTSSNISITGVPAAFTLAAPAGTVSVALPGTTAPLTLAALAGAVSATIPGATAHFTIASPAGSVTTGTVVSIAGQVVTITLSAKTGAVSVSIPGASAGFSLAAPPGLPAFTIGIIAATASAARLTGATTPTSAITSNTSASELTGDTP